MATNQTDSWNYRAKVTIDVMVNVSSSEEPDPSILLEALAEEMTGCSNSPSMFVGQGMAIDGVTVTVDGLNDFQPVFTIEGGPF